MPPIFVIVGPPAVGKSTTARALAGRFPLGLHIPVDDLRMMVVSGLALPAAEWSEPLVRQIALARATAARMALAYHDAGFAVVIDDFWDGNHAADYAPLLDHPALRRVILLPDEAEARRRNRARSGDTPAQAYIDEGIRSVYAQLAPVLEHLTADGWRILDTSTLSAAETVDALLS
jgi:predicted kinase